MFNLEPPAGVAYLEYMDILRPYFVGATPPTTTTTTLTTMTTTTSSSTAPTGSGTAQRWQQCGGNDWRGPTQCASPWTCTVINQWYHQCL
ncbi:hypothetical protein BJX61DRAFT_502948 [Aspergillus egyptiacus]|nr:hypothetical protein BJX61DRAFT_502948 [Aspergillus egyptiacus]